MVVLRGMLRRPSLPPVVVVPVSRRQRYRRTVYLKCTLPQEWAADAERRAGAGVPPRVGFAIKGLRARAMLARAWMASAALCDQHRVGKSGLTLIVLCSASIARRALLL
jgi:hypothetical protein